MLSFTDSLHNFVRKKKSGQLEIQDGLQGNHMTIFTIIIIFTSYELCYLGPTMILPSPWHLFMTHNY